MITTLPPLQQFRHSIRHGLWLVVGVSVATNLLLAPPIYSLQIFDRVPLSRSVDTLWVLTFGVTLALMASVVLEGLRGQVRPQVANRIALAFERRLFDEILARAGQLRGLRGIWRNPRMKLRGPIDGGE